MFIYIKKTIAMWRIRSRSHYDIFQSLLLLLEYGPYLYIVFLLVCIYDIEISFFLIFVFLLGGEILLLLLLLLI